MFRVYDYTDATRLFGEAFITRHQPLRERKTVTEPIEPAERTIEVQGVVVHITDAGRYIVTEVDGKAAPVTVEEYKQRLAERLVQEAPTLDEFRAAWVTPSERQALMGRLPDAGRSALLLRDLDDMRDYDLYDVLADLGYGLAPKTRIERAQAFAYKHSGWLGTMPPNTAATIQALAGQFALGGTEGIENPNVFQTPEVVRAGGIAALRRLGRPSSVLTETKERMFAA
jgi:type I restriction enzyme R subunit